MIYIENHGFCCSLFKVERLNGPYFGWSSDSPKGWYDSEFIRYPNTEEFTQTFLAPSILDRWT